jgi:thiamine biosynthesis lipoprotein
MLLNRRDFMKLGLGACLLPAIGCSRAEAVVSEEMYVFGTLVGVDVLSADAAAARAAIADVSHTFTLQNRDWHAWKPGALGDLNRALAASREHVVEADLLPLLHEARDLARASGGLFNPAIGRLVGLPQRRDACRRSTRCGGPGRTGRCRAQHGRSGFR